MFNSTKFFKVKISRGVVRRKIFSDCHVATVSERRRDCFSCFFFS